MAQVMLQMLPDAGDQIDVMRFAVAQTEARKDAQDAQIALGAKQCIGAAEGGFRLSGLGKIIVDDLRLYRPGHIAAGVLQDRDEIIGRVAEQRVLKIQQTDPRRPFALWQPSRFSA